MQETAPIRRSARDAKRAWPASYCLLTMGAAALPETKTGQWRNGEWSGMGEYEEE